jgi:excisionase family DNA binding protein
MELINVTELARYIRLSKSSVYKLVMNKKIPHLKVTGTLLFDRAEIDTWLKSHRAFTVEDARNNSANILRPRNRSG